MPVRSIVLDIATSAIDGVEGFIEEPSAPSNWKDPAKIAAYVAEARAELVQKAGLDLDLARITGIGTLDLTTNRVLVQVFQTEDEERAGLTAILPHIAFMSETRLIGFNLLKFDLPLLARRCAYLGLKVPTVNLDKFKTPHLDVWAKLSYNGAVSAHALSWYVRRLGWTDLVKPLTGAEESQVPQSGRWEELKASILHDVTATHRLAGWAGLL